WGGSFKTGRGLLDHVLGAESLWLQRLQKQATKGLPKFSPAWSGADFRDEMKRVQSGHGAFLDGMDAASFAKDITYTNIMGETWSFPLGEIFTHIVNHGTYHRGQISHLLRDMGLAAPGTDYVRYLGVLQKG